MSNLIDFEPAALPKRGINEQTCAKWGYGYGELSGRRVQVAQYRNAAGVPVAQKLRFPDKDFLVLGALKESGLYGEWLWRDGGRMVVVTEGEIDALSVSQIQNNRWPVVSVPTGAKGARGAVLKSLEWLEKFDSVIFMFDNDEDGQAAAIECAACLQPNKAKIAKLPLKDANAMLVAGRGKEVVDAMWGAKVHRPDGIVAGEEVWDAMQKDDQVAAYAYPHAGLQAKTQGLRGGELVTICAGTSIGKSTYCRELAYSLLDRGATVGYVALEEPVKRTALGLLSVGLSKPLHIDPEAVSEEELREAWDFISDRLFLYDHFGSLDSGNLLSKLRFLIRGCGCGYVFLDHLSIVVSGIADGDERRTIDNVMTALASLAQETGACIVLVTHLRRTEGKPHEEGKAVTLGDLRGSASIAQLSHDVIALERDQQSDDDVNVATVRVLKCRWTGQTGRAGFLRYEPDTGRLREYEPAFDDSDAPSSEDF